MAPPAAIRRIARGRDGRGGHAADMNGPTSRSPDDPVWVPPVRRGFWIVAATLYAGTAIAGLGFGTAFLGAFRTLVGLATPDRRADLVAAVYVVAYLAFSLPAIVAGVLTTHIGLQDTATWYGITVVVLAVAAIPLTLLIRERAVLRVAVPRSL